ncbi:MAG TPA: hypothetical protein VKR83_06660 [Ktedonobacteraceae bacterium]|nr:hypothetical protein [Ktedonobacteraceae bacterium]
MNHPADSTLDASRTFNLWEQSRQSLRRFFQQPLVKKSVDALVPGVLAAVLFPIFGPIVAAPTAVMAIQNSLKLIGISLSATTIDKLLNPLKGKQIEEIDILDALQEVLPKDQQINDEAAKALVTIAPEVKEAALQNKRIDQKWLSENLAANLQAQGGTMAIVAPKVEELIQLDDEQMREAIKRALVNWSHITQTITVSGEGEVSKSPQSIKARDGDLYQGISATGKGKVTESPQSIDLS